MTTKRWLGLAGIWTDAAEWSPPGTPGPGDTAVLGAGANVSVSPGMTLAATVVLADPTANLTVQGDVSGQPAPGAVTLTAVNGGGSLTGMAGTSSIIGSIPAFLDYGLLLVGSPDPTKPFTIQSTNGTFALDSTLDVVGTVSVSGAGTGTNSTTVFLDGPINVEPGGTLVATGSVLVGGAITIAGGTLDASRAAFGAASGTVSFAGSSGTLTVNDFGFDTVANFRAGDVIDVKGVSKSGPLSPTTNGAYQLNGAYLTFTGPTTAGATYTATPDGTGGTFVTASGGAAGRAPASQYIFGFNFSAATIAFGKDGHAALTAPNGTVTDVTGVATLQFLDGTISERTGTPVDPLFYYARNPDVWAAYVNGGLNAQQHYDQVGWREGRDPDALFSTRAYLAANPDVAAAGIDPAQHYDQYGWHEGRDAGVSLSPEAYSAANPDIAAAGIDPLVHYLEYGEAEGRFAFPGMTTSNLIGDFDPQFYLAHNPDVAAAAPAGLLPASFALQHYLAHGWTEGRDPDAFFSTSFYLAQNPDVARSGADPLLQFEQYGWHEGRNPGPGFNTAGYLAHNPDVTAAGIDPLQHYLQYGMAEGRAPG